MVDRRATKAALDRFVRAQSGPPFATHYQETPAAFSELLRAEREVEEGILRAFRRQGDTLDRLVDWEVVRRMRDAAEGALQRVDPVPDDAWEDEDEATAADIRPGMERAAHAGVDGASQRLEAQRVQRADEEQGSKDEASRWADNRSGEEAKNVNSTSRRRMRGTITQGVDEGWSSDRMAQELAAQGFDRNRATMIARTEVIRAWSVGSQSFARLAGADRKQWAAANFGNVCPICQGLDGRTVGIEDYFDGRYFEPPDPHPQCRCVLLYSFSGGRF